MKIVKMKCKDCNGNGYLDGNMYEDCPCAICDGAGEIEVKTAKQINSEVTGHCELCKSLNNKLSHDKIMADIKTIIDCRKCQDIKELPAPDSEGWWWYHGKGVMIAFVVGKYATLWDYEEPVPLIGLTGTWIKAIVPSFKEE